MSTFTRKHYENIAAEMQAAIGNGETAREIADRLADCFEDDNPNFKRERFLSACGIREEG